MLGEGVFYEEAVNATYPEAYDEAVAEAGLDTVGRGEVEIEKVDAAGYTFKAKIPVRPEVKLGEYVGIKAQKPSSKISDEELDAEMERIRRSHGRLVSVEDRAVEDGDTVVIDFEGFVDGVAFEGGQGGKAQPDDRLRPVYPGFEEQLIGKSIGEDVEVNVSFPEDYHEKSLAGKPAVFKVKIFEIKFNELPELNDEFAKDVSEFDTLDEYKNSLREKLQSDREKQEEMNVENQIFDALIEKVQGEIPEEMYEQEVEESINNFAYRLQSQGLNLETYLKYTGMDVNAIKEQFRPQSEKQLKLRLALEKIAELENLEVSDEAVEEEYEKLAKQYNMEVAQIKNLVAETQIRADLKNQKAIDFVKENASVKAEKPAKKTTRRKSTKKAAEEKTEETAEAKTEE